MIIIGVDFHPEFQQIASIDTETGEFQERHLAHPEEVEKVYRAQAVAGQEVNGGGRQSRCSECLHRVSGDRLKLL